MIVSNAMVSPPQPGVLHGIIERLALRGAMHLHPAHELGTVVDGKSVFEQDRHLDRFTVPEEPVPGQVLIYMFT